MRKDSLVFDLIMIHWKYELESIVTTRARTFSSVKEDTMQ